MSDKLEAYLEEISHFLSGRIEREEILNEIRSHILEKAAEEPGAAGDAAIEEAIAAYGKVASTATEKDVKEEAAYFIAQSAAGMYTKLKTQKASVSFSKVQ